MKKAGEHLKTAGNAFISLTIVAIITYVTIGQELVTQEFLNGIIIGATVICGILLIVIGAELRAAGQELQKLEKKRADNEFEKRMKKLGLEK